MATETTSSRTRPTQSGPLVRHTKVPTLVFENARDVDKHVVLVVESLIRERSSAGQPTVLGLPTGSTPIGVYRELIRLHQEEDLDFSNVITFNLDEYWPLDPESIHSYNRWMHETFFNHVNIPPENIHIPKGNLARKEIDAFCDEYEYLIEKAGGIDLQLLGIGRTGHVGFNEPGSARNSGRGLLRSIKKLVSTPPQASLVKKMFLFEPSRWESARLCRPARSSSWLWANIKPRSSTTPSKAK